MNRSPIAHYRKSSIMLLILSSLSLASCSEPEHEVEIPLSAVPDKVLAAVNKALPSIELSSAEIESAAKMHYELEGKLDGKEYEIEINPDGSIIEIEQETENKPDS